MEERPRRREDMEAEAKGIKILALLLLCHSHPSFVLHLSSPHSYIALSRASQSSYEQNRRIDALSIGPKVNIQHSHELHAISMPVMRREISHRKNINFKRTRHRVLPTSTASQASNLESTRHWVALEINVLR